MTLSNDRHLQTQYVLPGIVCFQCDTGSGVGTDSTFLLDQVPVDRIVGNIVQGVLVIFESDEVLGNTNHDFSCSVDGATVSSFVLLRGVLCPRNYWCMLMYVYLGSFMCDVLACIHVHLCVRTSE